MCVFAIYSFNKYFLSIDTVPGTHRRHVDEQRSLLPVRFMGRHQSQVPRGVGVKQSLGRLKPPEAWGGAQSSWHSSSYGEH